MTSDLVIALVTFALVATVTPGPNNLMVMASGAQFGFVRTLPHLLGITAGFTTMILLVGLGLMQAFDRFPWLETGLTAAAFAFLLYLAWRIATAGPPGEPRPGARPLKLWQAAAFQWVNPKAWAMALSAISLYAADRSAGAITLVAVVFGIVSLPCIAAWTLAGGQVRAILTTRTRARLFNGIMAALLIVSMMPALL